MWRKRKNKPTVAELKSLYESEMYQNLLHEFTKRTNQELDNERDESELLNELTRLQKHYAILDTPFEEILSEFERSKDQYLDYRIANLKKCNHAEIELPLVSKIDRTYLLECFCDFYLLQTAARKRFLSIHEYLTPENVHKKYLKLCERIDWTKE